MRYRKISTEHFKNGRIELTQKETAKNTVDFWKARLKKGSSLPPVEIRYNKGKFYVVNGHHRIKAHIDSGEKSINVMVTSQKEYLNSFFKRGF